MSANIELMLITSYDHLRVRRQRAKMPKSSNAVCHMKSRFTATGATKDMSKIDRMLVLFSAADPRGDFFFAVGRGHPTLWSVHREADLTDLASSFEEKTQLFSFNEEFERVDALSYCARYDMMVLGVVRNSYPRKGGILVFKSGSLIFDSAKSCDQETFICRAGYPYPNSGRPLCKSLQANNAGLLVQSGKHESIICFNMRQLLNRSVDWWADKPLQKVELGIKDMLEFSLDEQWSIFAISSKKQVLKYATASVTRSMAVPQKTSFMRAKKSQQLGPNEDFELSAMCCVSGKKLVIVSGAHYSVIPPWHPMESPIYTYHSVPLFLIDSCNLRKIDSVEVNAIEPVKHLNHHQVKGFDIITALVAGTLHFIALKTLNGKRRLMNLGVETKTQSSCFRCLAASKQKIVCTFGNSTVDIITISL